MFSDFEVPGGKEQEKKSARDRRERRGRRVVTRRTLCSLDSAGLGPSRCRSAQKEKYTSIMLVDCDPVERMLTSISERETTRRERKTISFELRRLRTNNTDETHKKPRPCIYTAHQLIINRKDQLLPSDAKSERKRPKRLTVRKLVSPPKQFRTSQRNDPLLRSVSLSPNQKARTSQPFPPLRFSDELD